MYTINDLYDLTHTLAGDYLARFTYPWEALSDLADCIRALGTQLDSEYLPFGPEVWVHRTAHVAPTASITGPCIIGPETEVRHCATAPLSGAARWWAPIAWWATPWS